MINTFRKNQRVLMTIIAIVTIISFVYFFNPGQRSGGRFGEEGAIKIYDRIMPQADIEKEVKNYQLAVALRQYDLLVALGGTAENEAQALTDFVFNLLVLRHEADALGVVPTQMEEAKRLQALPEFQTNGQYDPVKYNKFVEDNLGPRGLTEDRLYSLMGDAIRLERIKEIVGAPAAVASSELTDAARVLQAVDVEVVRFPIADAGVVVSDDEIKTTYDQYQKMFVAPETRSVQFVEFVSPEALPEDPKARIEAQQKLADAADNFAKQARAKGFAEAASAASLAVKSSPELDHMGQPASPSTGPDGKDDYKNMAAAAFLLSQDQPVSDVVQAGDRFFVLKLANVTPQQQQAIEAVRPMIEARLKAMKAQGQLQESAQAALGKLQQALAGGKSFADAVKESGLKSETVKAIDLSDPGAQPEQRQFGGATALLKPGQLSGLVPTENGLAAVYLVERHPLDPEKLKAQEEDMKSTLLSNKQMLLFLSWLTSAREGAKITQQKGPERQQQ